MWKRQCDYNKLGSGLVDQLDNAIPLHIGTFLKLGLQPDPDKRGDMDLQEIYLMLRLQAAVLCQSQQKEVQQQQQYTKHQHNHQQLIQEQQNRHHHQTKPPTGFKQHQHGWEAVKERMKKCNNSTVTEFSSPLSQSPVRPKDSRHENSTQTVHVLNECLEEETETSDDPIVGWIIHILFFWIDLFISYFCKEERGIVHHLNRHFALNLHHGICLSLPTTTLTFPGNHVSADLVNRSY